MRQGDIFVDHTSGSTGTPMTIHIDKACVQYNYALISLVRSWAGIGLRDSKATFGGRLVVPIQQQAPPFWRYNPTERQLYFSSYHMSAHNLEAYVDKLQEFQPKEIEGYPSSIYNVARYMKEKGRDGVYPTAVITNAEMVLDHQRRDIEEQFQCKVYDYYGTAENLVFAGQCPEGNYHICPDFGIIEVVQNDKRVPPGQAGDLICTGLRNYAMPLIRYRIGDTGILTGEICPCGRTWPLLKSVLGRKEDFVVTPDGRLVGRLDPVFKGLKNIAEAQIIQETRERLVVKIVKGGNYTGQDSQELIEELRKRVGFEMDIQIQFVDAIPRGPAGKFRFVVSNVSGEFK